MIKKLLVLLAIASSGEVHALTEHFDKEAGPGLPAGWSVEGTNWSVHGGALWRRGPGARQMVMIEKAGDGAELLIEAQMLVRRVESTGGALAGLCIVQNASNFWQFALVEAPQEKGAKRYIELVETFEGRRQAQNEGDTRLVNFAKEGREHPWEMNKPYRLRLTMRDGRIEGTLHEMDGKRIAQLGYELKEKSVSRGKAAALVTNLSVRFDDFLVEVAKP